MTEQLLSKANGILESKKNYNIILGQIKDIRESVMKSGPTRSNIGVTLWHIGDNEVKQNLWIPIELMDPVGVLDELEASILGKIDELENQFKNL